MRRYIITDTEWSPLGEYMVAYSERLAHSCPDRSDAFSNVWSPAVFSSRHEAEKVRAALGRGVVRRADSRGLDPTIRRKVGG